MELAARGPKDCRKAHSACGTTAAAPEMIEVADAPRGGSSPTWLASYRFGLTCARTAGIKYNPLRRTQTRTGGADMARIRESPTVTGDMFPELDASWNFS